jgi:hypothetical protein
MFTGLVCFFGWVFAEREIARRDGERELVETQERVAASDPDWSWEKYSAARRKPPAGKNGADLIPKIKKLTRPEWGKEFTKEEWKPLLEIEPNVRYSPLVVEQVRRELTDSADAVQLARSLKDRPFGHREIVLTPNVLDTLLPDTQDTRAAADLLQWDTVLAVEDDDRLRAVNDLLALLNAGRSIGDEPFLISQLVRMACTGITVRATERFLAQAPGPTDLSELQRALAAEAEEPLLLYGARGERAAFDRLLENMQTGVVGSEALDKGGSQDSLRRLGWWRYRANLPAERAYGLEWLSRFVEAARRPVHEQPALVAAIPEPPNDSRHVLVHLLLPAVEKVAHAHWRTTALARCAAVGIACERFRQEHKRWPTALNELVPAFLPAVPLDPYDGLPLRYTKWEDGVVVYSVGKRGQNRFDRLVAADPVVQTKPGLPEGIEYGFRLWNPDKRRLPPLPDPPAQPAPEREPPP